MCGMSDRLIEFTSGTLPGLLVAREHPVRPTAMIVVRVVHRAPRGPILCIQRAVCGTSSVKRNARHRGRNRRELAANILGCVRLGIETYRDATPRPRDRGMMQLFACPKLRPRRLGRARPPGFWHEARATIARASTGPPTFKSSRRSSRLPRGAQVPEVEHDNDPFGRQALLRVQFGQRSGRILLRLSFKRVALRESKRVVRILRWLT